ARGVDERLAGADLEIGGEERLGSDGVSEPHPHVVAPAALALGAHRQRRLVPSVADDPLGGVRVLGAGLGLAARAVGDAHDVAARAAVHEEALDGAREIADLAVAESLHELVPAVDAHRLVERSLDRQPDEARRARVGQRDDAREDVSVRNVYAGRPDLAEWPCHVLSPSSFVDLTIDARDLSQPDMSLLVFHGQDVVERPVEVIRNVGRLLPELLLVHGDRSLTYPRPDWPGCPPSSAAPVCAPTTWPDTMSTSNSFEQDGHLVWSLAAPSSLILR